MEHKVTEGKSYLITAKGVTTVTDVESGYVLKSIPSNSQGVVVAISDKIEVSGECNIRPFDVDLLTRNHPATYPRNPISDWKAYMLKRAEMTGEQKNIDTVNRAIIGDALLSNRFNEDYLTLSDYQSVTGETLASDFWVAYFEAVETLVLNPNEVKVWTIENNPYINEPLPKNVVDFSVSEITGSEASPCLNANEGITVFLPSALKSIQSFRYSNFDNVVILPKSTQCNGLFRLSKQVNSIYLPAAKNCYAIFNYAKDFSGFAILPSCHTATSGFSNTSMSVENIAKTLDSLPSNPIELGGNGVIHFSRNDGTKLAPLMAESPYKESVDAAIARGWTVQFD